jgi:hypothetical protein
MNPERMQECLTVIRWSPSTLALSLEIEGDLVERWLSDIVPIPVSVASWLEALCFTHEASDLMRPAVSDNGHPHPHRKPNRLEHVPVYSYNLLRALERGPVALKTLFGTDDEGAVFFLVSRGLAERQGSELTITGEGRKIGQLPER